MKSLSIRSGPPDIADRTRRRRRAMVNTAYPVKEKLFRARGGVRVRYKYSITIIIIITYVYSCFLAPREAIIVDGFVHQYAMVFHPPPPQCMSIVKIVRCEIPQNADEYEVQLFRVQGQTERRTRHQNIGYARISSKRLLF